MLPIAQEIHREINHVWMFSLGGKLSEVSGKILKFSIDSISSTSKCR